MGAGDDLHISAIFGDLQTLKTDRTVLRKLTSDDAVDLFEYGKNPEVTRYTGWDAYQSVSQAAAFLKETISRYQRGLVANWGVEHRVAGKLIGTAGFLWWEPENATAEIGYALSQKYWGQGIMTEVVRRVIQFGFETMHLNRIEARSEPDNVGSYRVMEKCGMHYEATEYQLVFSKGRFVDLKRYAIVRTDHIEQM